MSTISTRSTREAEYVVRMAAELDQRTGQFLFNYLRHEVAEAARGTVFDPFEKDLSQYEVEQWLESHIIYNDDGKMIAFFIGDLILWEEE
jgi:hypothetical protein